MAAVLANDYDGRVLKVVKNQAKTVQGFNPPGHWMQRIEGKTLFIHCYGWASQKDDFENWLKITSGGIITEISQGGPSFGFVNFESEEDCTKGRSLLHRQKFNGAMVTANLYTKSKAMEG